MSALGVCRRCRERRQPQTSCNERALGRPAEVPMRRKIVIVTAVLIVVLAGGGFAFMHAFASKKSAAPPASPPVPIVAGVVAQHDVPIYLTGVGTVIAYNTVVVRSQIQGQIVSINFTEGQSVHTGDLLAQIDARPYQAQINQYTANLERDQ